VDRIMLKVRACLRAASFSRTLIRSFQRISPHAPHRPPSLSAPAYAAASAKSARTTLWTSRALRRISWAAHPQRSEK
jgi:hypothetical protein